MSEESPRGFSERLQVFSDFIEQTLSGYFKWHGNLVARFPYRTIGISLLCVLLSAIGFMNFTTESRTEKLWVPQDSRAIREQEWVIDTFGYDVRFGSILVKSKGNHEALTREVVLDFYTAHSEWVNTSVRVTGKYSSDFPLLYVWDETSERYADVDQSEMHSICFRSGQFCDQSTILDVLSYDYGELSAMSDAEIVSRVNNDSYWFNLNGRTIEKTSVLGGIRYDGDSGLITAAQVLRGSYIMSSEVITVNNENIDPSREEYEIEGVKAVRKGDYTDSNVVPFFSAGFSQEFSDAIAGDIDFVTLGYGLLFFYTALAMGKRDAVHSMIALAVAAIGSVGLALVAAFGLASGFGFVYTPLHGSLPFLILGLGVDDAFILAGEFQRQTFLLTYKRHHRRGTLAPVVDVDEDIIERMTLAMKHAGMSVLITSLTDFIAFSIGSSTILPALRSFCLWAAFGVLIVFLLNITFFAAWVVLDARRVAQGRRDCFCCFKVEDPAKHTMFLKSDFVMFDDMLGRGSMSSSMRSEGVTSKKPTTVREASVELETIEVDPEKAKLSAEQETDKTGAEKAEMTASVILETEALQNEGAEFMYANDERQPCCFRCHELPEMITQKVFRTLAEKLTQSNVYKGVVLGISATLLAFGIYGATQLEQDFDIKWFLPDDSYLQDYYAWDEKYYSSGTDTTFFGVYTRESDEYDYFGAFDMFRLTSNMLVEKDYVNPLQAADWHGEFYNNSNELGITLTEDNFFENLGKFVQRTDEYENVTGYSYRQVIKFKNDSDPSEGVAGAYQVGLFRDSKLENAEEQVEILNKVRRDVHNRIDEFNAGNDADVSGVDDIGKKATFPFTFAMIFWEQYKVIYEEFFRNVLLSFAVIFVITLVLIPNVPTAILVLVSVGVSIIDVLGMLYFADLTIDGITVSYVVIGIGLCVDYSAHIGEAFIMSEVGNTRDERIVNALYSVGASVFNGAFSTLLAVITLAFAATYIFRVFFFVFSMVTVIGSFHGLVVLPVLLSLFGPKKPPLKSHSHSEL